MTLLIEIITSVLKDLTNITSITAHPIRLAVIPAIMSVLNFTTTVLQYVHTV